MKPQSTFVIIHPDGSRSYRRSARDRQIAEVFGTSPLHRANVEARARFTEQDHARADLRRALSDPNITVVRRDSGFLAYLVGAPGRYTPVDGAALTADVFDDLVRDAQVELDSMSDLPDMFYELTHLDNTIDQWRADNWTSSDRRMADRQEIWAADLPGYSCTSQVAVLEADA
jgi:hypothetical protein